MSSLNDVASSVNEAISKCHQAAEASRRAAVRCGELAEGAHNLGIAGTAAAASRLHQQIEEVADEVLHLAEDGATILGTINAIRTGRLESAHDPGSPAPPPSDRWITAEDRRAWFRERISNPATSRLLAGTSAWSAFQRKSVGIREVMLEGGGEHIWADDLALDPDAVVALEAKYVENAGRSMYEGRVSERAADFLFVDFDDEILRYAAVLRDPGNPVRRLRLIASTPEAARFLGERAQNIVGPSVDLDVRYESPS